MLDEWSIENTIDFCSLIFLNTCFHEINSRKLKAHVAEKTSLSSHKFNLFCLCFVVLESVQHTSDRCDVENRVFQKNNIKYSLQVNSELSER